MPCVRSARHVSSPSFAIPMVGQPASHARPGILVTAAVIAVVVAVPAALAYRRAARLSWARDEAIPEIIRLSETGDTVSALALAKSVEREPARGPDSRRTLVAVLRGGLDPHRAGRRRRLRAAVRKRDGRMGTARTHAADHVTLARAAYRIRIEKEGFEPRLLGVAESGQHVWKPRAPPVELPHQPQPSVTIELVPQGTIPSETLPIPGAAFPIGLSGFDSARNVAIPPFAIDRMEVTNRLVQGIRRSRRIHQSGAVARPAVHD